MPQPSGDITSSRAVVAETMTRVIVPGAILVGLALLTVAAIAGTLETVPLGLTGLGVGLVGKLQERRANPEPSTLLVAASVGCAASAPFTALGEAIAILLIVTLLAFVGVFTLSPRHAVWFMSWCGVVAVWTFGWHLDRVGVSEAVVGLLLIVGTGVSGWRLLTLARDAVTGEEERYRVLFDASPVAIFEEDYTGVGAWLDDLRAGGVFDLRTFLFEHPDVVRHGIALIRIRSANSAAAELVGAGSVTELARSFARVPRDDVELVSFIEQFIAIWEGRTSLALDLDGVTLEGQPLEAVLHWSVATTAGKPDLSRVIVAISDITPRKQVEERLARAVESNERLLAFEHALAACSRALLLGVGEDALEVALETLREAMGADRAYLAINLEDPDVGPAFKVVNSASKPEYARDDWVGLVVPWSKYPMAIEPLSQGKPFRHLGAERPGEGWSRSLLAVPVYSSGEWSGTVGFVDIDTRTEWTAETVRMLEVAAPMLGNFWEREVTRKRLEELVHSKDRFLASISHELRTPLSAVLGFAEELKSQAATFEPHEATEILELIAEQSRDMADMVEDLLVGARADVGTISIHPEVVYLRAQAETALVALGSTGTKTVEVVGGPGKTWADPTRTRQMIRNLLTNAVRHGGSHVVIEATSYGSETVLTVRDDGPGLDRAEWERIFEPYQRAHDRPTEPASIGLGLTVSRQLARLMGGDLVYRADEDGSVFELTLPSQPPEGYDIDSQPEKAAATAR